MHDITIYLGKRIRELRKQQSISQEELGFKAGISAAHLGQIERALKNPTIETVDRIAAALGVSLGELFSEETVAPPKSQPTIAKIEAQLTGMSEDEQRIILRVIRAMKEFQDKECNH